MSASDSIPLNHRLCPPRPTSFLDAASQVMVYARKVVTVSDCRLNVTFQVVKRHQVYYSVRSSPKEPASGPVEVYTRCHRLRRRLTSIRRRRCDTGDGI